MCERKENTKDIMEIMIDNLMCNLTLRSHHDENAKNKNTVFKSRR